MPLRVSGRRRDPSYVDRRSPQALTGPPPGIDLDDLAAYATADPSDYLSSVETLPDQINDCIAGSRRVDWPGGRQAIKSVAVLGVGGSAIAGDILSEGVADACPVFIQTIRGYDLPGWVGPGTLVFALSYSGNTEETIATFQAAVDAGAQVVAISTGGKLAGEAQNRGVPSVILPSKGLQPRAALGYLSVSMMEICRRLDLFDASEALRETADILKVRSSGYSRDVPTAVNPAKKLAGRLAGLVPVIYGCQGISEVAAYRWKCQFNECSKLPAFHNSFSELTHNEIVGWSGPADYRIPMGLIVLRQPGEHPRVGKRIDLTIPAISDRFAWVEQVSTSAQSWLARLFDLIYLGDFVAAYLALLRNVDPTSIEPIDRLKRQLSAG